MKLRSILITELFDQMNMDDVEVERTISGWNYTFADKDVRYKVYISPRSITLSDLLEDFVDKEDQEIISAMDDPLHYVDISLSSNSDMFRTTGRGNFGFVYSKLLASLNHYIDEINIVDLASFSGAEPGMDLIYKRMLKRFAKTGDQMKTFYPLAGEYFISEHTINNLDEEDADIVRELIKTGTSHYEQSIQDKKRYLEYDRLERLERQV